MRAADRDEKVVDSKALTRRDLPGNVAVGQLGRLQEVKQDILLVLVETPTVGLGHGVVSALSLLCRRVVCWPRSDVPQSAAFAMQTDLNRALTKQAGAAAACGRASHLPHLPASSIFL